MYRKGFYNNEKAFAIPTVRSKLQLRCCLDPFSPQCTIPEAETHTCHNIYTHAHIWVSKFIHSTEMLLKCSTQLSFFFLLKFPCMWYTALREARTVRENIFNAQVFRDRERERQRVYACKQEREVEAPLMFNTSKKILFCGVYWWVQRR